MRFFRTAAIVVTFSAVVSSKCERETVDAEQSMKISCDNYAVDITLNYLKATGTKGGANGRSVEIKIYASHYAILSKLDANSLIQTVAVPMGNLLDDFLVGLYSSWYWVYSPTYAALESPPGKGKLTCSEDATFTATTEYFNSLTPSNDIANKRFVGNVVCNAALAIRNKIPRCLFEYRAGVFETGQCHTSEPERSVVSTVWWSRASIVEEKSGLVTLDCKNGVKYHVVAELGKYVARSICASLPSQRPVGISPDYLEMVPTVSRTVKDDGAYRTGRQTRFFDQVIIKKTGYSKDKDEVESRDGKKTLQFEPEYGLRAFKGNACQWLFVLDIYNKAILSSILRLYIHEDIDSLSSAIGECVPEAEESSDAEVKPIQCDDFALYWPPLQSNWNTLYETVCENAKSRRAQIIKFLHTRWFLTEGYWAYTITTPFGLHSGDGRIQYTQSPRKLRIYGRPCWEPTAAEIGSPILVSDKLVIKKVEGVSTARLICHSDSLGYVDLDIPKKEKGNTQRPLTASFYPEQVDGNNIVAIAVKKGEKLAIISGQDFELVAFTRALKTEFAVN